VFLPCLLMSVVVFANGCSDKGTIASVAVATQPTKVVKRDSDPFLHDFGMLHPKDEVSHRFEITNSADVPWTVKEIQTNCSCTVPTISAETIQPGKTEWVNVVYHAGSANADDKRTVYVAFTEPGPVVPLTVKAKIREPITVTQREIVLEAPYQQKGREYFVEVRNYDERPWESLELTTKADWFTVESHKLAVVSSEMGLQEVWRIVVAPKAQHLKPDWYQEMLDITANGRTKSIPIRLRVISKLDVRPEQLFFGIVEPNSVTKKTLLLTFRDDIRPMVDVSTDLGDVVSWQWITQESTTWILEVSFRAKGITGVIEGSLSLTFPDSDIDAKRIALKAMIKERTSDL